MRVPPGRHALPRSYVQGYQRERIMRACADICAEETFHRLTVTKIVRRAGIARNTFYDNYGSKEDSFEHAFAWAIQMAEEGLIEATGVDAAVEAVVHLVEAERSLANLVLIDAPAGAPQLYDDATSRLCQFSGLPEPTAELVVGGVMRILSQHIREPADDLLPGLQEFVGRSFDTVVA